MKNKFKTSRSKIQVPIYGCCVQVVVAEDIVAERQKQNSLFGPITADGFDALCSRSGCGDFALFFERGAVLHRNVAHEIFHLTHRIMEWCGADFDHEAFAYLNGFLHEWVYSKIGSLVCK